jgi:hypothetical protein
VKFFKKSTVLVLMSLFLFVCGSSHKMISIDENQSYISWYDDNGQIEINMYVINELSRNANFYLYIVQKDLNLANTLGIMTLPVNEGTLFNIEEHGGVLITEKIKLREDIIPTEQQLSEAYEIIVGYIDDNEKEIQATFPVKMVKVVKGI